MLTPIQDLNSRKPPHVSNISKKPDGNSPSSNGSSETNSSSAQKVWIPFYRQSPLYLLYKPPTFGNIFWQYCPNGIQK